MDVSGEMEWEIFDKVYMLFLVDFFLNFIMCLIGFLIFVFGFRKRLLKYKCKFERR